MDQYINFNFNHLKFYFVIFIMDQYLIRFFYFVDEDGTLGVWVRHPFFGAPRPKYSDWPSGDWNPHCLHMGILSECLFQGHLDRAGKHPSGRV